MEDNSRLEISFSLRWRQSHSTSRLPNLSKPVNRVWQRIVVSVTLLLMAAAWVITHLPQVLAVIANICEIVHDLKEMLPQRMYFILCECISVKSRDICVQL